MVLENDPAQTINFQFWNSDKELEELFVNSQHEQIGEVFVECGVWRVSLGLITYEQLTLVGGGEYRRQPNNK